MLALFGELIKNCLADQTQREQKQEAKRLERLDDEIRVKTADELDDYCDTICKLHSCQFGQQDVHRFDACLCFDYLQQKCELV